MKRKGIFILTIILLSYNFTFSEDQLSNHNRVVKWGYMANAAPLSWFDRETNTPMGVNVEIIQDIMNELGLEVEHHFYPWSRVQHMVKLGELDGMSTTPNSSRWKYSLYGKENCLPNYWNLFFHKDNTELAKKAKEFTELEQLKEYETADFIGNGWAEAFMSEGYKKRNVRSLDQMPMLLARNKIDYIISSSSWINWRIKKLGLTDSIIEIENENIYFSRFHFVFMVSRESPWIDEGLLKAMDRELIKMKESGKWHEILRKYENPHGFGKPFKTHLKTDKYYMDYDNYPEYIKK